jgi:signal transduction histidine kinase
MRGRVRVPLFVVALALLGLIGLLATLQFQWLGRISEAERDRLRATLETGASAFAHDLDAELTRAYLLFQSDPLNESDDPQLRFAARYDRWHATSKYPRLIRSYYRFEPDEKTPLERFDPATRTFAAAEWPDSMRDWRARLIDVTEERTTVRGGDYFVRRLVSPIWETVPAIVVPSPLLLMGGDRGANMQVVPHLTYTILEVDRDYVAREMLPALAEEHFTRISGADFQIAVVSRKPEARVIYHSSDAFNPAPGAAADVTTDLFAVRPQDFSRLATEVHSLTAFAANLRLTYERSAQVNRKGGGRSDRARTIVVEQGGLPSQPAPQGETKTSASTVMKLNAAPAIWQLVLTHQTGSLEAAVNVGRRRNLIVSSSILGVLGASMALLLLSTRRAQRLAQQQMEFVATVSHELRTPLAVIRSAGENLADGIVEDESQVRKYGELVRGEGRRLTDMVEQILEFSGIQSGERRLHPVPVAIGPLVRDVVDSSASLAQVAGIAGIDIELDLPDDLPPVLGDEPALGRVFQNLLTNAVKYGAAGGWIGVDARRQGNDVLVTVADRGIGIAPSDQERIFEPFYRAPAVVEAQVQGAGLGLSLVQRIVEAHGGAIAVRSSPGAGAAFTVRLPVASSEPARKAVGTVQRAATPGAPGAKAPRYS